MSEITVRDLYQLLDLPKEGGFLSEVIVEVCERSYDLKSEKCPLMNDMVMAGVGDYIVDNVMAFSQYHYYIVVKSVPVKKSLSVSMKNEDMKECFDCAKPTCDAAEKIPLEA